MHEVILRKVEGRSTAVLWSTTTLGGTEGSTLKHDHATLPSKEEVEVKITSLSHLQDASKANEDSTFHVSQTLGK